MGERSSRSWASRKRPADRGCTAAADVEQVLRIKHLLLVEGLTLAGARRRLEEETAPVAADAPAIDELIGQNARDRLTEVKRGLRVDSRFARERRRRVPARTAECGVGGEGRPASQRSGPRVPASRRRAERCRVTERIGARPQARRKRPA